MGSAGLIAGCLIGTSVVYTIIMGFIALKTVPTTKVELSDGKGEK